MTERDELLGRRIASRLSGAVDTIDVATLDRLRTIREGAVARRGGRAGSSWSPSGMAARLGSMLRMVTLRRLVPIGALAVALVVFGFWQEEVQKIDELADVDAGLLAGDLPIDAYLDKGLDAWLTRSQQ